MQTLFDSTRYKSFIQDRDKALEQVHLNAQLDLSRMTFDTLDRIENFVAKLSLHHDFNVYALNQLSGQLDTFMSQVLGHLFPQLVNRIKSMRQAVFTLTYASELEAIGRATQKTHNLQWHQFKQKVLKSKDADTLQGTSIEKRVWLSLSKLQNKILDQFNLALVQELEPKEVLEKVSSVFPKIQSYKRPPRQLKPLREVNQSKPNDWMDTDFIDQSDWELAVQSYKDSQLAPSRFDTSPSLDPEAGYYQYNWELEQDVTDDFVKQVRNGQVDAANDLGIKEFVWVAIIDNKTDECCVKRNGKTTSEIQTMLQNGKLNPNQCDATTPPAHPHCRCQLSPVASVDQVEGPDWSSFGDWLNS